MKTIEQISHEICDKYSLTIDLSIPIESAIKEAQIWIDVNDELPPKSINVLVKNKNGNVRIFNQNDAFMGTYLYLVKHYTHWRPIELQ